MKTVSTKRSSSTGLNKPADCPANECERSDNSHEESDYEEERRERSKRRKLSRSAHRCEDQGTGRLARRNARAYPEHHQAGRPRRGRGMEMAGRSGVGA